MVMKDKLTKNHHSGVVFKIRNVCVASIIFLSLLAAITIPTYITLSKTAPGNTNPPISETV